jgi:hypothetical protein
MDVFKCNVLLKTSFSFDGKILPLLLMHEWNTAHKFDSRVQIAIHRNMTFKQAHEHYIDQFDGTKKDFSADTDELFDNVYLRPWRLHTNKKNL